MLPETVAEKAAGRRVAVARLFEFEFAGGVSRFWDGHRTLMAGGNGWLGVSKLISVSGLSQVSGMTASQVTFRLSGASQDIIDLAVTSEDSVTGRPCAVYIQFLSAAHVALDSPIAIWSGLMDVLSFQAGIAQQSVSLTAEGLFVSRVRAPFGYMTDTDQQARWPGDKGMEFMPALRNKTVNWLRS